LETEDPCPLAILCNIDIAFYPFSIGIFIWILILLLLLISSALISGSEVAYFSLSPSNLRILKAKKSKKASSVLKLHGMPERLLATILVANNFINIGIVILSSFITNSIINFSNIPTLGFVFQVIIITFLLLLFGEILPKIYATHYAMQFSTFMTYPLFYLEKIFKPVSSLLIYSTSIINKRLAKKKQNISMDELSEALELPSTEIIEDEKILKGIVKFRNIDVKEIMKSRVDVFALDIKTKFRKLLQQIIDSGYSRIPIFSGSFDNIKGILYIKDLLPHLHKNNIFKWQSLIRSPYFVPETKKINDLLEEFQSRKIHLAIVIDEYGGTHGIITLEDILEEIVGEITDECDEDKPTYSQLDKFNYIFEGKTLLNDFYKIVNVNDNVFDEIKGDADTLAGLILEIKGKIPEQNDVFRYRNFSFKIDSVDFRRIKRIRVTILPDLKKRKIIDSS
jgi:putative hemolysin